MAGSACRDDVLRELALVSRQSLESPGAPGFPGRARERAKSEISDSRSCVMPETIPPPEIDKSEERIRRMFGEISPRYDFLNHFLSGGTDWYWRCGRCAPRRRAGRRRSWTCARGRGTWRWRIV